MPKSRISNSLYPWRIIALLPFDEVTKYQWQKDFQFIIVVQEKHSAAEVDHHGVEHIAKIERNTVKFSRENAKNNHKNDNDEISGAPVSNHLSNCLKI